MRGFATPRTGILVAGLVLIAFGCSASSAAVTRVADPQPPATQPAAATTPTTTAPTATAVTASPPAAATTPSAAAPPTTATTAPVQKGPILDPAPPLPKLLAPVSMKDHGAAVAAVQQRLLDLGFWNQGPTGNYDWVTQQSVMAFQKYNGLDPSGTADPTTIELLDIARYRAVGKGWNQDMIEVDKAKQLLFIIRGGHTVWVMNTSTGSGQLYAEPNKRHPGEIVSGTADTPEGLFHVYSQQSQGWWEGDLGSLYRPKFFAGGSAVHGAPKVPNFPASHGCVRVTPEAMDFIWAQNLMPMRSVVWVHS
jgi:hypothetical protein